MKRYLCLLLLITWTTLKAQSPFGSRIDSLIQVGIECTIQSDFDSALVLFSKAETEIPDHPVGPFYLAATLQSAMMDYETDLWENEFYDAINRAIELGESGLEKSNDNAWMLFYLGNAYGYKGLYLARSGAYLSGFRSAHKGIGLLEDAIRQDSTLYDADLMIGNYKYWSGKFYKLLRWLPFISDERELGVSLIHKSIEKGNFSKWVGLPSLGWIEFDRKNYLKALDVFHEGSRRFPESRFYLWGVGACYQKLEHWENSIRIHAVLLESIQAGQVNNGFNEAECRKKLMEAYFASGNFEQAMEQSRAILSLQVDQRMEKRIRDHREEAGKIEKQCLEKIK